MTAAIHTVYPTSQRNVTDSSLLTSYLVSRWPSCKGRGGDDKEM